jgi:hypothetical protein
MTVDLGITIRGGFAARQILTAARVEFKDDIDIYYLIWGGTTENPEYHIQLRSARKPAAARVAEVRAFLKGAAAIIKMSS